MVQRSRLALDTFNTELSADHYLVTHEVGPNQHGIRLDHFLMDRYRKRSREFIKKAIDKGAITLKRNQGAHLTPGKLKSSSQLIPGDEVLVMSERKPEPDVCFDYKLIFEDETLFVIEKPANLPVHPAGRYFFNTLLVHLKTSGHKDPLRPEREYYLAHRIDKETSGILVLTRDREVCAHISKQFFDRKTEKKYLAIVRGVTPEKFTVNEPLKRATGISEITLKMKVCRPDEEDALPSHTDFERLEVVGDFSVVECRPKTGRQHQIRVHLDHIGHPIVGDKLYGIPESESIRFFERQNLSAEAVAKLLLPRHALHSAGLKFDHPITGKRMEFTSELPPDLREFLNEQNRIGSTPSLKKPAPHSSEALLQILDHSL